MITAELLYEPITDLVGVILDVYRGIIADVRNGKVREGATYGDSDIGMRDFRSEVLVDLIENGRANIGDDGVYVLTEKGEKYAANLPGD